MRLIVYRRVMELDETWRLQHHTNVSISGDFDELVTTMRDNPTKWAELIRETIAELPNIAAGHYTVVPETGPVDLTVKPDVEATAVNGRDLVNGELDIPF